MNETLGETYEVLVERADAQTNYLTLEAAAKETTASGEQPDMVGLDMARERVSRASRTLASCRSTLSLRIEDLAAEQT